MNLHKKYVQRTKFHLIKKQKKVKSYIILPGKTQRGNDSVNEPVKRTV